MDLIDLLIGVLLMNPLPHFIFGITKTRFLGLFGFSPNGNIAYAALQFVICLLLFHFKYNLLSILENGLFVGGLTVLILYFGLGKLMLNRFNKNENNQSSYH